MDFKGSIEKAIGRNTKAKVNSAKSVKAKIRRKVEILKKSTNRSS
jgi:hypothetical protein